MISADGGITHYAKAYKLFAIISLQQAASVCKKKYIYICQCSTVVFIYHFIFHFNLMD